MSVPVVFPSLRTAVSLLTGAGAEEGPEAAYKREEELENARKGGEMDIDPEGILDEDDEMGICVEDKETQTGNLNHDVTDKATQASLKAMSRASGTQTGTAEHECR